MEKLIELLNEYDSNWGVTGYGALFNSMNEGISEKEDLQVISKKFGFIKWLVDNDKIDFDKVEKKFYNEICITDYGDKDRIMGDDDLVIAVLSVQDNPIEFLISILR